METTTSTPVSSSSASSSSSSPASSAPASSTPATSTPASTPAQGTTPAPLPTTVAEANNDPRSTEEIIREHLTQGFKDETPVAGDASVPGDDDQIIPPDAGGDNQQQAADDDQQQAAAPVAEDVAGTEQLNQLLESNEALKAAIEADPAAKGQLYEMARAAAEVNDYRSIVGSPEEARVVVENGNAFVGLSDGIASIDYSAAQKGDYKAFDSFVDAMVAQTIIRDENGQPVLDAKGQPQTDGSVGSMFKTAFTQRMDILEMQAKQAGNDEALAALDVIRDMAGIRPKQKPNLEDMPEDLRRQQEDIDRQRADIDRQTAEGRTRSETEYFGRVGEWSNGETDKAVDGIVKGATGLDATQQATAKREIMVALNKALKASQFKTELKKLNRLPFGPAREQQHKALATRYLQTYLGRVSKPILAAQGAVVMTKEQQRTQRQAASSAEAQSDARGALTPGQNKPTGDNASSEQIVSDLTTKLGREPSTFEIFQERGRRAFSKQ